MDFNFSDEMFLDVEAAVLNDPKVRQMLVELENISDPETEKLALGLFAELMLRMGREDQDPTGGKLRPFRRGITARNAPDDFELGMLLRLTYKIDGVESSLPLVVYNDELLKTGFNPATTRFIASHSTLRLAEEEDAAKQAVDANLKYSALFSAAAKSMTEKIGNEVFKQSPQRITMVAKSIMSQCMDRVKRYHVPAYLTLRRFEFVPLPVGMNYTMSVGPTDRAMTAGAVADTSSAFDSILSMLESRRHGNRQIFFEDRYGSGPAANIALRYSPTFVLETVLNGAVDLVIQRSLARMFARVFDFSDTEFNSLFNFSSMLDGVTAILIHEAMHTLRGHNLPASFAYDKTDKVFGDVFKGIVNSVGDAMINQNIVRTTDIPLMLKGGIIKSWSFPIKLSPEKLYREVVEKPFADEQRRNKQVENEIARLHRDCIRNSVKDVSAALTFSWPSTEGKDVQFFTLTRLTIRALASSAASESTSRYEKIKKILEEGIKRAEAALIEQEAEKQS